MMMIKIDDIHFHVAAASSNNGKRQGASSYDLIVWGLKTYKALENYFEQKGEGIEFEYDVLKSNFYINDKHKLCDFLISRCQVWNDIELINLKRRGESALEPLIGLGVLKNFIEINKLPQVINIIHFLFDNLFLSAFNRLMHLVQYECLNHIMLNVEDPIHDEKNQIVTECQNIVDLILNEQRFDLFPHFIYHAADQTLYETFLKKTFPEIVTQMMCLPNIKKGWLIDQENPTIPFYETNKIIEFFDTQPIKDEYKPLTADFRFTIDSNNILASIDSENAAASASATDLSNRKRSFMFNITHAIDNIQKNTAYYKRRRFLQHIKNCAYRNKDQDFEEYFRTAKKILRPFFCPMSFEIELGLHGKTAQKAFERKNKTVYLNNGSQVFADSMQRESEELLDFNTYNIILFIVNSFRKYYRNMVMADEVKRLGFPRHLLDGDGEEGNNRSLDSVNPYFLIFHSRTHGTGKSSLARELFIESFQFLFPEGAKLPMKHDPSVLKPKDLSSTIKLADAGSTLFQFFDDLGSKSIDIHHLKAITSDSDYSFQYKNQNEIHTIPFCFNPVFTSNLAFDEVKTLVNDPTGSRRLLGVVFPEYVSKVMKKCPEKIFGGSGTRRKKRDFAYLIKNVNPNWDIANMREIVEKRKHINRVDQVYKNINDAGQDKYNEINVLIEENLGGMFKLWQIPPNHKIHKEVSPLVLSNFCNSSNRANKKHIKKFILKYQPNAVFVPSMLLFNELNHPNDWKLYRYRLGKNIREQARGMVFYTSVCFFWTQPNADFYFKRESLFPNMRFDASLKQIFINHLSPYESCLRGGFESVSMQKVQFIVCIPDERKTAKTMTKPSLVFPRRTGRTEKKRPPAEQQEKNRLVGSKID